MLENYLPILIFIAVGLAVGVLLLSAGCFPQAVRTREALALRVWFRRLRRFAHEIRCALLPGAILFIIFDLEIAFLFPWAVR